MRAESITTRRKLDPKRWQRLKDMLAEALEQPSAEGRTALLRRACADDSTLLHEAEELLSHDTVAFEEFAQFAATRLRPHEHNRIGERLGAYAIVGELGRGGMGAVYLAERADGQFQKRVAIKVLKRGTDTDEVLRRFRIERQILAELEHPNITRLLDAGTTSDGLPYFVMEFIEGTPITRFVQQEKIDLPGRLQLFLKICSAVDVAHRHQIIHRDIKPGNVLVNEGGEPKLLDFGIAKLLSSDSDDDVTTVVAERRLTPMSAAPEQRVGQPATVAADVYSLGALLYELLVNKSPRNSSNGGLSLDDLVEHLVESSPTSHVADAKMKRESLDQLNQIVDRAMQLDPAQRYPAVVAMAEDIQRYLNRTTSHFGNFSATPFDENSRSGNQHLGNSSRRRWYITAAFLGVTAIAAGVLLNTLSLRWLRNPRMGKPTSAVSLGTTNPVRSIAVLPFEPVGKDMNDERLGLGMADAVIGRMSSLKQLVVLPTSAVSRYKGPTNDPLAAGRALGVDAILSGTVQRSGDRVRATVQLVRVASGGTVWSEKFDETFTDIFGLQDAISDNVARSLALNLTSEEQKQLAKRYTTNAGAYDEYLMGLYFWNTRSRDGVEKAINHFGRAIENDPNFALAYALMSDCYYLQLTYGYNSGPDRIQKAQAAAERALSLDNSIAEGHVALAMVQFYQKDDQLAESDHQAEMDSLRRAVALNPNLAVAHQRYAWALAAFGHLEDSLREMRRAQELDPLSHVINTGLGTILVFARQYHEALNYFYRAAELAPNQAPAQSSLAFAYLLNGMYQQAIDSYQKAQELNPGDKGNVLASIATVLVYAGRKSEADSMMPEILKLGAQGKVDPYFIVAVYAARNERDAAFDWFARALQKARERRSNGNDSREIRYDPLLDPLRSDPRFAALLRQHNMSPLLETAATPANAKPASIATIHSIAVLPFEPLGRDMDDELLGLGMADAVIGRISNLKELAVLPTSAVSRYRGPANDPFAAGRALGVDAILSGTIQRSGDQVRATVQLVAIGSGRTLWSEKFDQTFTDIFGLQDSISDSVARSLALNLTAAEQKQLRRRYTTNPAAYDSYLMGLYFWNTRSKEGLEKAIHYFERAVEKDPNFALAYALISDCYFLQLYYGYDSRPDRIRNARIAAEHALQLDDSIAEAHVAAAMVQFRENVGRHAESDHQEAMDSLRRAISLNPNLAIAHQRYAWSLSSFGHLNESVREIKRAQELDPLSATNNTALGLILIFARQYREALAYCSKAAELAPNEAPIQENLGAAYALNGMYEQAIEHYRRQAELTSKKGDALASIATVLAFAGRKSEADAMMPGIVKLAEEGKTNPYNIAILFSARGEKDAAFEWLGKSLQERSSPRITGDARMIRYDPMLDPLRSDPRFAALLRQNNFGSLLETTVNR
jgi:eukaryotic-like serine/threonine-protein kinase